MIATDCDFLEQIGQGRWRTTRRLQFKTRFGEVDVPAEFETDLFTVVGNTKYPDFWKAAILHDYLYHLIRTKCPSRLIQTRRQADIVFYDEMLIQSAVIFSKLQNYVSLDMAVAEFLSLLKTSRRYYWGVSGIFGRVYQAFAG
jgi:hypothetical protein